MFRATVVLIIALALGLVIFVAEMWLLASIGAMYGPRPMVEGDVPMVTLVCVALILPFWIVAKVADKLMG